MTMQTTIWLGVAMAGIAIANASLMAWLWRFPMQPDPTGRDPHGVSTAPRFGTNLHRALGYVFIVIYAALLIEMVPRIWQFRAATAISILHGVLGILIGVLLVVKIAIIRRFQRFGNRLPWIGGTLAVTTVVVASKCNQCHGASMIAGEREDARKWERITREMQRFSRQIPGKEPISDEERILAAAYLTHALGEEEDDEDDGGRGRRRGRGRGRR